MTTPLHLEIRAEEYSGADFSRPAEALRIAAVTPFTTIDFPGKLSAVVFVQGCPWRCGYCQNEWMQVRARGSASPVAWSEVEKLLGKRQGLLDGVVFSGGEATMDPALLDAVRRVKTFGMAVALHTAGAYPRHLEAVLPFIDWVGLDVKAPPDNSALFDRVTGRRAAVKLWTESFERILDSGVAFEIRQTAHPSILTPSDIEATAMWLFKRGISNFALQIYRRPPGVENALPAVGADYPGVELESRLARMFAQFTLRRE